MGRLSMVALATSVCLLFVAAAQRAPWMAEQLQRTKIVQLAGLGGVGAPSVNALTRSLSAAQPPSWSTTDQSVAQLQQQLKEKPDDPLSAPRYASLGNLYLQKVRETGDPSYYVKAESVLKKSLDIAPDNALAELGMGALALERHDFAGAVEWGQKVLAVAPRSYAAYGMIGDGEIELGRYPEAIDAFQHMVDLRPDLSSYARVSYARELYGDLPNAIAAMQQAVDAGAPRSEGTSWARVQLANLYFNGGDLEGAEREYQAALRLLPDYVHALAGEAKIAAARGDLKGAADLYAKALNVMPWPQYAIELGDVYRAMGNNAAAQREDDLVRVIAQLQRANGVDVDMEMELFEADHATSPTAIAAALQNAQAIYDRRPSVHGADALAWTLYRAGKAEDALPHAREALKLGSKDPVMLFHAGAIAAAAGQPVEARGYLEQALNLNPAFSVRYAPEAKRLLAQLKA